MTARFSFRSPQFTVEFHGSEEFVTEQIALARGRILAVLDGETPPADPVEPAAPPAEEEPRRSDLEKFYHQARTREGRGALQDSILIFAHYMHHHQGKREFSIDDLNFCFDLVNARRPKSLANTLGILKRDRQLLHAGSQRGAYALSERGAEQVGRLI